MLNNRKLISLLIVVAIMLSVFSVAIVSASAADGDTATIIADGVTYTFHEGDTIRYKAYMDVTNLPYAADGYVHVVDAVTYYGQSNLSIVGEPDCYTSMSDNAVVNPDNPGEIWYNDSNIRQGFLFNSESAPLMNVQFKITAAGETTITNAVETLSKSVDDILKNYIDSFNLAPDADGAWPNFRSTVELVDCPHPDEPTVAPTEAETQPAADKAIVTIRGLDGESATKEFNVDDL